MSTFEINGKTYESIPFSFNTVCDLEDMGFDLDNLFDRPVSAVRAYFGLIIGNKHEAGKEIEEHIIAGGDVSNIMTVMQEEIANSGFFGAMAKAAEKQSKKPQDHKKKQTKAKTTDE